MNAISPSGVMVFVVIQGGIYNIYALVCEYVCISLYVYVDLCINMHIYTYVCMH